MANEEHLALIKRGVEVWNKWREENPGIKTDLVEADLSGANLSGAKLVGVNFWGADLIGTNLVGANLIEADLVKANLSEADFSGVRFLGANLAEANLSRANLSRANLSRANLSRANLSKANLIGANLTATQALGTNFQRATLTGADLQDWNINSATNLDSVICDYVYLKANKQERRPHDPNKIFAPGEFTKLFQKALETVDLIFKDGIDWQAFLASFQKLQVECGSDQLSIQAIEKKSGGAFVIRVEVPTDTNKAEVEKYFWQKYKPILKAKDEQLSFYHQEIEYKRIENTRLIRIIETMAERESVELNKLEKQILDVIHKGVFKAQEIAERLKKKIKIIEYYLDELKKKQYIIGSLTHDAYYCQLTPKGVVAVESPDDLIKEPSISNPQYNDFRGATLGGGVAGRDYTGDVTHNYAQQGNLAEAAAEIQQLLEQLSQTYPTTTTTEQMAVATKAIEQIESDPTWKQRAVKALKQGTLSTLETNPVGAFVVGAIKGWQNSE